MTNSTVQNSVQIALSQLKRRWPQRGQAGADLEISALHAGHSINDIR